MSARYNESRALRIIGQELKRRGINLFELRLSPMEYYLRCDDPNLPDDGSRETTFSDDEIAALDSAAARDRGNGSSGLGLVDFAAMSEILRAIGRYVENMEGTLLRISRVPSSIDRELMRFEYRGEDGQLNIEQYAVSTLTEMAMRMYNESSFTNTEAHRGAGSERSWRH
ncbi:MAG: hypothetical protein EXR70_13455 [Deltaproteobacteria bacterium]|nr:hypothetical protein [Deltaproteobacteria bacterium]